MNKVELKPCPFCGGKAYIHQKSWDIFTVGVCVECDRCGVKTEWIAGPSLINVRRQAAEIWNNRTSNED